MQFTAFFALACASIVTATPLGTTNDSTIEPLGNDKNGCFTGGASWGSNKGSARAAMHNTCRGDLGDRDFSKHESRTSCYGLDAAYRYKIDFRMQYLQDDAKRFMSEGDCVKHLGYYIDQCEHGGKWSDGKWEWK